MSDKAAFERLLGQRPRVRSAHFAVYYRPGSPGASTGKLSTAAMNNLSPPVDDCGGHWLGAVLPKRWARRAVTRNLLRRQVRAAVARHADTLAPGQWLVRLRAAFDPARYPSAASSALRRDVRAELDALLAAASA